jgi:hypothetical protein
MSWRLFLTKGGLIDRETYEWCQNTPATDASEKTEAVTFRFLVSRKYYDDLPLVDFWAFLGELLAVFSELRDFNALTAAPDYETITRELEGIRGVLARWVHTEGHGEAIKGFDYMLMNAETMGVNHLFRTKAYYTWRVIETKWWGMFLPFVRTTEFLEELRGGLFPRSSPEDRDELRQMIRSTCYGDSDETVIFCMEFIKNRIITEDHVRLATVTRLAMDPRAVSQLVDGRVGTEEAWRILFPTFFDDTGNSFDTFYAAFENHVTLYFIEDYLKLPIYQIQQPPLIPDVVLSPPAADVLYMYGIELFRTRKIEIEARNREIG